MYIYSMKDPAFALINKVTVALFFPDLLFFFYYFSEYSWTDCILDLLCIASITNFSCGDDTTDHSFFVCSADCIADSIRTARPLICFVGIV